MLLLIYNVQTFHESNFFTKEVTKELISGNIFCGMVSHTKKVKVKSNKIQKMCYLVHQFSTCTSVLTVLPTFAVSGKTVLQSTHSFSNHIFLSLRFYVKSIFRILEVFLDLKLISRKIGIIEKSLEYLKEILALQPELATLNFYPILWENL